jgi:hypothetical protein
MMKKTYLFILWATALLLTAACANDSDMMYADVKNLEHRSDATGIYDGEWTVNKQVVDTARLEITEILKLRLPEDYLTRLCFPDKSGADSPQTKGTPMVVELLTQGYSKQMELYSFLTMMKDSGGKALYGSGYFYVTIGDTDYRIDLLCSESSSSIFRLDTGLWTIAIPIRGFLIVNTMTNEEREQSLSQPVTIYYNAKQRIR